MEVHDVGDGEFWFLFNYVWGGLNFMMVDILLIWVLFSWLKGKAIYYVIK